MKSETTTLQQINTAQTTFSFDYYFFPGKNLDDTELKVLTNQLHSIASSCFPKVPKYQALTGEREELSRCIIIIAKDDNNEPVAFTSSLLLEVEGIGEVLHLGLTCVAEKGRGKGLTRKLSSKLIIRFLFKHSPFRKVWISNVACVISSLSNVSLYFEDIYPSTFSKKVPSQKHRKIAKQISQNYRNQLAINDDACFNKESFVFEGSVQNSVFQKDKNDKRYFHRNAELTKYYQKTMDFERGDEVLQIGKVSTLSYPIYLFKAFILKTQRLINNV